MANPDSDADADRSTNPRYDDWPVERYAEYAEWPVERATPRDEGGTIDELADEYAEEGERVDVEMIGFGGSGAGRPVPYVLGPDGSTIFRGELDEANERVLIREAHDADEASSLGARLESFGEDHDWAWLSSFARQHLQDEDREREVDAAEAASADASADPVELDRRNSEFDRRNLPADSPFDLGFYGSHTFADASGRVYMIERDFDVRTAGRGRVTVEIDEDYLVAAADRPTERSGDADLIEERSPTFDLDVDGDAPNWETLVKEHLQEWHADHVGWPDGE